MSLRPLTSKVITLASVLFLLAGATTVWAQSPPQQFTANFTNGSQIVTVNFERYSIRSPNFSVVVQGSSGAFNPYVAAESATYLGTPVGYSGAIACATRRANGSLLARVFFEDGSTWSATTALAGGAANRSGNVNWTPQWPTFTITTGAGPNEYAAEVGIDSSWAHFNLSGLNITNELAMIEHSVLCADVVYLRDAGIVHRIGRVVIRGDATMDPYNGLTGGALLDAMVQQWNNVLPPSTHDLAAMLSASSVGGGLGYVGVIGTGSRYSVNDSDSDGDFSVVWRHEAGHNWGSGHYEGGGRPEGGTIMSDNNLSRFSSPELAKIVAHRNTKLGILDNLGSFAFPLPPRASMDVVTAPFGNSATIDVLANDHDGNGEGISILSFDPTSNLGGAVTRSVGGGPGGRDVLSLQVVADHGQTDWFRYRIADTSGRTATGIVYVQGENPSTKLSGVIIGSTGSWNNNPATTKTAAMDGNLGTFYDAINGTGDWVGRDLGAGANLVVTKIKFAARAGFEGRMNGGVFQAANVPDFSSGVVTLFTVTGSAASGALTTVLLTNNTPYRYVRYLGPTNGFCNVAEIEFWGAPPAAPRPPNGFTAVGVRSGQIALTWNPATLATSYNIWRADVASGPYTAVTTGVSATAYTDSGLVNGQRYYYVVSGSNNIGDSAYSREASAVASATPAGDWKFNDAAGSVATDASGYGNDGTVNSAGWVAGFRGTALRFNGVNSSVTFGTGPAVSGTNDFTLSAWVKTTATAKGIILQQRDANGFNGEYQFSVNANGTLQFMLYGDNAYQFDFATTPTVNNGQWHHVVAVRNGAVGRIYLDGNPAPAGIASGTVRQLDANISVAAGRDIRDSNANFNGTIDEVRIYKTVALSGSEVQGLYNSYFVPVAPRITAQAMLPDGTFSITGTGGPGATNVLNATTNLSAPIIWSAIQTNITSPAGLFNFLDTSASNFPGRFYRVSTR